VKGGVVGGLGLAEDTSDASVACRQTGPITFLKAIKTKEEIWNESTSILFKKIRIVRFYDTVSNSLVYLVYSDKLIEGSPKNSISAIALEGTQVVLEE
jgi:CreA protein